jgi:F0F1-type ATP synthase membrane subunit b/b'
MEFIKKEWKTILFILWSIFITYFLIQMNNQIIDLKAQNAKISSTLDSVESVSISTDSGVAQMSKNVDDINANVSFIVQKVRRR